MRDAPELPATTTRPPLQLFGRAPRLIPADRPATPEMFLNQVAAKLGENRAFHPVGAGGLVSDGLDRDCLQWRKAGAGGRVFLATAAWEPSSFDRVLFVLDHPDRGSPRYHAEAKTCVRLARAWGFGGVWLGFLFDRVCQNISSPVIRRPGTNDGKRWLTAAAAIAGLTVVAWGGAGIVDEDRSDSLLSLLSVEGIHVLGLDKGAPLSPFGANLQDEGFPGQDAPTPARIEPGAYLGLKGGARTFRARIVLSETKAP